MNPLCLTLVACALGAPPGENVISKFEDCAYTFRPGGDAAEEVLRYRLLKPVRIEPGRKYPVLLFLHGAGERGDDNVAQLQYLPEQLSSDEYRAKYPCFLIAPQGRSGRWWANIPRKNPDAAPATPAVDQLQAVEGILRDVEKNYPVDPRRIYLTGLSMGGYGSWELAARHPDWFAAVVPICGGGDVSKAARLVDVPVWAVHGGADAVVPPERSREMIAAIKSAGGQPKYTELDGVGHNSWTPGYSDATGVLAWMFDQVNQRRGP